MDDMPTAPAHAKPGRRDLLWVLVLILACGLLEVWASWLSIGAVSGFPKLGRMTTGWILPVTTEAYWTAALYAWLAGPAGPRSKKFAMWSAVGVFLLSLAGQESDHLLAAAHRAAPPVWVVGFVTALPLIAVALIAVLIHLRHLDQAAAAVAEQAQRAAERQAHEAAAEAGELAALRAELEAACGALEAERQAASETARQAAETAQRAERAEAKAEQMARKLAGQKPNARRTKDPNGARRTKANGAPNAAPETTVPDDIDARTQALELYLANPKISGKDLGAAVGLGERWGQLRKNEFATAGARPGSGQEPQ